MWWFIFFAAMFGGLMALGSGGARAQRPEYPEPEYDYSCDNDCGGDCE